ncbi:MAG: anthranilate phosphoribosyltransferase [Gemmatimonadota bacterium]
MREWIRRIGEGEALTIDEAEAAFDEIMRGRATPIEMAALLVGLKVRGETADEVAGGVRALRRAMVPVPASPDRLLDTCGTGGGTLTTFNISTAAALVAAAGGARVAKHGNRSFTSRSGSADVLESLGVPIELPPAALSQMLEEVGFAFLYAPRLHPAMRHIAPVRAELGMTTVMNVLGPLANPASVRRQVVGVAEPHLLPLVAGAMRRLGHEKALVVHGEPGMDELSPLGLSRAVLVEAGELVELTFRPEEFGWSGLEAAGLAGGEPAENAQRVEGVLRGKLHGAARAAVVLNAAAALYVTDLAADLSEGVEKSNALIDDGAAWESLQRVRAASRRLLAADR